MLFRSENQLANIHASVESLKKTKGIDAAMGVGKESLTGEQREFDSAWTDFKTVWGTQALPMFSSMLRDGAEIIRYLGAHTAHLKEQYDFWSTVISPGRAIGKPAVNGLLSTLGFGDSSAVAPGGGTAFQFNSTVNMDGQKVGRIVTGHIVRMMPTGSQTGPSSYVPANGLIPPGGP